MYSSHYRHRARLNLQFIFLGARLRKQYRCRRRLKRTQGKRRRFGWILFADKISEVKFYFIFVFPLHLLQSNDDFVVIYIKVYCLSLTMTPRCILCSSFKSKHGQATAIGRQVIASRAVEDGVVFRRQRYRTFA